MDKLDIPQGTLDLMIVTILAREPMHGSGLEQHRERWHRVSFAVTSVLEGA